jgi:hypothetical protein
MLPSVSFDDVNFTEPEGLCYCLGYGGPTVQNHTDVTAMDANTVRKCSLTSLTFNCRFQQNERLIVIKDRARRPLKFFERRAQYPGFCLLRRLFIEVAL